MAWRLLWLWCVLAPVLGSKIHALRGVLEDHHLERVDFARRTPMKVALGCAVVTSIITYGLYKVYIDSMLRRRELDEDELEQPKAALQRESSEASKDEAKQAPKTPKAEKKKTDKERRAESSCCYGGLVRLGRSKAADPETTPRLPKTSPDAGPAEAVPKRPDFSGTWRCTKAEGDLDGLYCAMGMGYFARCAMERAHWGAGQLCRTYEMQGNHVKLVQRAAEETTQEFDITGTPQKVSQGDAVVIQTTSWDEKEEGVLLFETKDLLGNNPNSWTNSRQYLKGDNMIIEVIGARGHQAMWTYERTQS